MKALDCRQAPSQFFFIMSESIFPISIGGTNPSGYTLVAVHYGLTSSSSGGTINISSSTYDFGMLVNGASRNHNAEPLLFASTNSNCIIYAKDSSAAIGTLTISSSTVHFIGDDNSNYTFRGSFAFFKFS